MDAPRRKSAMDVGGFLAAQQAAAQADGVALRKPALPTFSRPTPQNVAAAQTVVTPNVSSDPVAPVPASEPAVDSLSAPKVNPEMMTAEFEVDLSLVDQLPTNSRFDYTDPEVDKMLADLKREGRQLKAIELTVSDENPGRFYAVDGYTRTLALLKWGKPTGRAIMVDVKDPWQRYKASWYANNGSRHTTDYDNGMRWRDMIDNGLITQPQISVELGDKFSAGNVSRVMSIAKLPEVVRAFIRENKAKLSSNFYYEAYQMMGELKEEGQDEKVLAMLKMAVDEDLSYREFSNRIEKELKTVATGQSPADTSKARHIAYLTFGGREVGEIKEWHVGDKLQISLKKVPAELRDRVKEAVRKILESVPDGVTNASSN